MSYTYHQKDLDELKRIGELFGSRVVDPFEYHADAALVGYHVNDVVCVTFTTSVAAAPPNAPELSHRAQLRDAYRKVVAQIRQTQAYAAAHRHDNEPVIQEEDFEYPKLRQINTQGIRRIRGMR